MVFALEPFEIGLKCTIVSACDAPADRKVKQSKAIDSLVVDSIVFTMVGPVDV